MILVVDDEPGIMSYLVEFLESNRIKALGTCSPERALHMAQQDECKCLITDIAMPKLNGIELAKILRVVKPDLKIICVSAYAEMMLPDLKEANVDFFVQKPFEASDLIECVQRCLGPTT